MSAFIPCTHPDLPGVVADLARPFGQWEPVNTSQDDPGSDDPASGESLSTPDTSPEE